MLRPAHLRLGTPSRNSPALVGAGARQNVRDRGLACSSSSTPLPDSGCKLESHFPLPPPPPPPPRPAHCPHVTQRRGRLRATRSPCSPSPAPLQARRPAALLLRAQAAPAPGERRTAASAAPPAAPPAPAQAPPPAEATFATADETVQIKPQTAADGSRFVWTRNWYPLVCAAGMGGMHGVHRWLRRRWGGKTCSAGQGRACPSTKVACQASRREWATVRSTAGLVCSEQLCWSPLSLGC